MFDINSIKQIVVKLFEGSGGAALSKQQIVEKVGGIAGGQKAKQVFDQIPDKSDYTPNSLLSEARKVVQKLGGGSMAEKVKSKAGV